MGLVLWLDENTFAASLVEKVFKKRDLPFYSLANIDDFSYLVEDLNPEVIVLDQVTALKKSEVFRRQYENSQKMQSVPFIILGEDQDLSFISKRVGSIPKPFEPFQIPMTIMNLMGKLN